MTLKGADRGVGAVRERPAFDSHQALLQLDPDAAEALRIAALTHDVSAWLAEQGADAELIGNVAVLVRLHEWGDSPSASLLQAADSISFLETTAPLARSWIKDRGHTRERSEQQFNWMLTRIQLPEARRIAQPLFDAAMAALDG